MRDASILFAVARHRFVYKDSDHQIHNEEDHDPDGKIEHAKKAKCDHRRDGACKTGNVLQHLCPLSIVIAETIACAVPTLAGRLSAGYLACPLRAKTM